MLPLKPTGSIHWQAQQLAAFIPCPDLRPWLQKTIVQMSYLLCSSNSPSASPECFNDLFSLLPQNIRWQRDVSDTNSIQQFISAPERSGKGWEKDFHTNFPCFMLIGPLHFLQQNNCCCFLWLSPITSLCARLSSAEDGASICSKTIPIFQRVNEDWTIEHPQQLLQKKSYIKSISISVLDSCVCAPSDGHAQCRMKTKAGSILSAGIQFDRFRGKNGTHFQVNKAPNWLQTFFSTYIELNILINFIVSLYIQEIFCKKYSFWICCSKTCTFQH